MSAIDTLHEIAAEVSALQSMANSLDKDGVFNDFGWGMGRLLSHVRGDLAKLEKEMLKETGDA
jgi:hypothetical protein